MAGKIQHLPLTEYKCYPLEDSELFLWQPGTDFAIFPPEKVRPSMKPEFSCLTTEELDSLKREAESRLKQALLDAAPFEEIRQREETVTQLAIAIHNRLYPLVARVSEELSLRRSG